MEPKKIQIFSLDDVLPEGKADLSPLPVLTDYSGYTLPSASHGQLLALVFPFPVREPFVLETYIPEDAADSSNLRELRCTRCWCFEICWKKTQTLFPRRNDVLVVRVSTFWDYTRIRIYVIYRDAFDFAYADKINVYEDPHEYIRNCNRDTPAYRHTSVNLDTPRRSLAAYELFQLNSYEKIWITLSDIAVLALKLYQFFEDYDVEEAKKERTPEDLSSVSLKPFIFRRGTIPPPLSVPTRFKSALAPAPVVPLGLNSPHTITAKSIPVTPASELRRPVISFTTQPAALSPPSYTATTTAATTTFTPAPASASAFVPVTTASPVRHPVLKLKVAGIPCTTPTSQETLKITTTDPAVADRLQSPPPKTTVLHESPEIKTPVTSQRTTPLRSPNVWTRIEMAAFSKVVTQVLPGTKVHQRFPVLSREIADQIREKLNEAITFPKTNEAVILCSHNLNVSFPNYLKLCEFLSHGNPSETFEMRPLSVLCAVQLSA